MKVVLIIFLVCYFHADETSHSLDGYSAEFGSFDLEGLRTCWQKWNPVLVLPVLLQN